MISFGPPQPRKRPSLTPMIDVVFLLLVFFMLASRFGIEAHLPLQVAGTQGEAPYSGPPRLVDIGPETLRLNGQVVAQDALAPDLTDLMDHPGDTVILRAGDGAILQRVVDVMQDLRAAGFTALVLVE